MRKPVILFVVPSAYILGGVQIWLSYLVDGLNECGFTAICGLVDGEYHVAAEYLSHYSFDHHLIIRNRSKTRWGRMRSIAEAAIEVDADLMVSVNIPDTYEATQWVRHTYKPSVKLLVTLHGLEPDYFADIRVFQKLIDGVLVTNRLTSRALEIFSDLPTEKIHYAPYGVELKSLPALTENLDGKSVRQDKSQSLTVLYSGRIDTQQKRCQDLPAIAEHLHNSLSKKGISLKLLLAGDGPYRKELENQLSVQLPSLTVEFLGVVKRENLLNEVLPKCDALLITSEWETGPIVAWEAMAAGVCVVSSRYLGSAEEGALVHEQNCVLFDIGDVVSAATSLETLCQSNVRMKLINAAHSLIEQRYTTDKSVETTAAVIRKVLDLPISQRKTILISKDWAVSGFIEKVFGHKLGCRIREVFKRSAKVSSAGDEWPHTLGHNSMSETEFRRLLSEAVLNHE